MDRRVKISSLFSMLIMMSALGAGCSDDDPVEIVANGNLSVTESSIRASRIGDDLAVRVPLDYTGSGNLQGTLSVRLLDIIDVEEPALGLGSTAFVQNTSAQTHEVILNGLDSSFERAAAAGYILEWRIETVGKSVWGRRSLYNALGAMEVEVRASRKVAQGLPSPVRVVVRDPQSGLLVSGATVVGHLEEEGQDSAIAFEGTTNVHGEFLGTLSLPSEVATANLLIDVEKEGVQVWTRIGVTEVVANRVYLSSDKTIYKPGQTIELRALAMNTITHTPIANEETVFEAFDGKGNKVFKRNVSTNEFGIASTSVPTDTRVLEGLWQFTVEVATAKEGLDLPVERYNLPKMKLAVNLEDAFVLPGESISGQVQAHYMFGEPVTDGAVEITVEAPALGFVEETFGSINSEGQMDFNLLVPAWVNSSDVENGTVSLSVRAKIVDGAGQQEQTTTRLPLASAPIVIRAIPETDQLIRGSESVVYLLVSDPLGRPLVSELSGHSNGAAIGVTTDVQGVANVAVTAPTTGEFSNLSITALDGAGRSHTRAFQIPSANAPAMRLRCDKAIYKTNDRLACDVIGPNDLSRAYVDLYVGNVAQQSLAIDLVGGRGELALDITEEMRGLAILDAYALGQTGQVIQGSRRIMIDSANRLTVKVEALQETYAPGEDATVRVSVQTPDGTPQVAAVGLTVVNEASFALGGEPVIDMQAFFSVDSSVIPASTRALGKSPSSIFSMPESDERQRAAEILFTTVGGANAGAYEYNSIREDMPVVNGIVETRVALDGYQYIDSFSTEANMGMFDRDEIQEALLENSDTLVDPFGQPYVVTVEGYRLTLTTVGPDETVDTNDDVSVTQYFDWLIWGDYDEADGGMGEMADGAPQNAGAPEEDSMPEEESENSDGGTRVRSDFRETVLAKPSLITDGAGIAEITFPLADSITSWRMTAESSTTEGQIGTTTGSFRTFQSFFIDFDVPVKLTKGDIVQLPAVVYNYLDEETTVSVGLEEESWLTVLSNPIQEVTLGPSEVRSVKFEVRIEEPGKHQVMLRGSAGEMSDALIRQAEVTPDGFPEDESVSNRVQGSSEHTVTIPGDTVEGGAFVTLTLTPGFVSEAVQGMDSLLQEPTGCFEQTTSSAWPNTVVTGYLEDTDQLTPELRERAMGLVTRGYQRLLTFESPTGGFNWWGDSEPGNRILSAIFLWHLKDLETLIETDDNVRSRTLNWLVNQQNSDGSWDAGDALHAGNEVLGTSTVRTTSFIAWALAHTDWAPEALTRAGNWLADNQPPETDLYANALAANALAKISPNASVTSTIFERLDNMKHDAGEQRVSFPTEAPSWTGASGNAADLETTGLVAYAMLSAEVYPGTAAEAVNYIMGNKDSVGTWYNTQATMNALRALSAAARVNPNNPEGTLTVQVNGAIVETIEITAADSDIYRSVDLTDYMNSGSNTVVLNMTGEEELSYRLTRRAYRPELPISNQSSLALDVVWDSSELIVGRNTQVHVAATNLDAGTRDQVIVKLGRPPGFNPSFEDLEQMVTDGRVSLYEVNSDDIVFYLMGVGAGESRDLSLQFIPGLAADVQSPESSIYSYYEPTIRMTVEPTGFSVVSP